MKCSTCKVKKTHACFPWKNKTKGQRRSECRTCWNAYMRGRYQDSKKVRSQALARAKRSNAKRKKEVIGLLRAAKDRPCMDCGGEYPYYVMQFDHLPGTKKLFALGEAPRKRRTLAQVRREISKCEVVCANCHAERTHQRRLDAAV